MRKITRKGLIKQLDKIAGDIVKIRDRECVTCGQRNDLTWSHVFSKGAYNTRWDFDNAVAQCWACNYRHVRDQYPLFNWYMGVHGKGKLDKLRIRFKTPRKFKNSDLIELRDNLQEILEGMK